MDAVCGAGWVLRNWEGAALQFHSLERDIVSGDALLLPFLLPSVWFYRQRTDDWYDMHTE